MQALAAKEVRATELEVETGTQCTAITQLKASVTRLEARAAEDLREKDDLSGKLAEAKNDSDLFEEKLYQETERAAQREASVTQLKADGAAADSEVVRLGAALQEAERLAESVAEAHEEALELEDEIAWEAEKQEKGLLGQLAGLKVKVNPRKILD